MAYDFKKLSDVAVVETPADNANVLIEEDGVIKKVAKGEVGGVKPDWNQNDETAPDYIKNRTHWSAEPVRRVIYPEIKIEYDGGNSFQTSLPVGDGEFFVAGKKYEVIFDGVKYTCTAFVYSHPNEQVVMLGANPSENFEESDYPFIVYITPPDYDSTFENTMQYYFGQVSSSEPFTHTIEVAEIVEEVHIIDPKYLPQPDMVITVNGMPSHNSKPSLTDVSITSGSFKALENLIRSGTVPNVVVRFCYNMSLIEEMPPYQVEATELKALVYWYGSGTIIRTVANDLGGRLISYKFIYSDGELGVIEMRYYEGTVVS